MAKGQKRSNREIKKPKAAKKPAASSSGAREPTATRITTPKGSGK